MAVYTYPTSAELTEIAQVKMPRLQQDRPIFDIMPITSVDAPLLMWEQYDNFRGLQAVRGYNGQPGRVTAVGINRYEMKPGIYGEFTPIDEQELTTRRTAGTFNVPVDLTDLVLQKQDQLLLRRLDRIEYIGWTLLSTGTFSIAAGHGSVLHTDTFTLQTYTAPTAWTNFNSSMPLSDFSSVQLLARGTSADLGAAATAYMNRKTFNNLRSNSNPVDIYGRRAQGFSTINNLGGINQLLTGDDLPTIRVYDQGYLRDSDGTFIPFIPDSTVIVIGKRPAGQTVGEYRMTRNVNNPDESPGPYMRVIDHGETDVPRVINVHDGHNGGPVIYFPSAIVIMNI